jgi:hypothetical protein
VTAASRRGCSQAPGIYTLSGVCGQALSQAPHELPQALREQPPLSASAEELSAEDAPGATHVKARKRDLSPVSELRQQDARDQEAREDKEDVDSDVTARQEGHTGVPESDKQNRNSSQTLDVVSVRQPASPLSPELRTTALEPTLTGLR